MSLSAYIDSQSTNQSERSVRIYKDLNLNFLAHPVKKDIQRLYDVESIKRSIRNLVNLNRFDKPFHPEIFGGVRELLFEPVSPFVVDIIETRITNVINTYERRVELSSVIVTDNSDNNEYKITIEFYILNTPAELVTLETILQRAR
jgi:phage baseplate assembly protein W